MYQIPTFGRGWVCMHLYLALFCWFTFVISAFPFLLLTWNQIPWVLISWLVIIEFFIKNTFSAFGQLWLSVARAIHKHNFIRSDSILSGIFSFPPDSDVWDNSCKVPCAAHSLCTLPVFTEDDGLPRPWPLGRAPVSSNSASVVPHSNLAAINIIYCLRSFLFLFLFLFKI